MTREEAVAKLRQRGLYATVTKLGSIHGGTRKYKSDMLDLVDNGFGIISDGGDRWIASIPSSAQDKRKSFDSMDEAVRWIIAELEDHGLI